MTYIGKRTALHVRPRNPDAIEDHIGLQLGAWVPHTPIVYEFCKGASGSTAHDFVGTSLTSTPLVSDLVVSVFRSFSGWTTYPVEVYGKKGELIPGYHGLAVTGRCGPIDDSRSVPRICEPPVPQGRVSRKWFGLFFDEKTWDGSDVFLSESATHLTFVSEAVKLALEKAKITNVEFTPLTECRNAEIPAEFL
jgi:hypothetical protein